MTEMEPMIVAVRAHATLGANDGRSADKSTTPKSGKRKNLDVPSGRLVVFDTETTTDHAQRLRFGVFQVLLDDRLDYAGIFYEPETLSPDEVETLREYVAARGLWLGTRDAFVRDVFFKHGYDHGGQIVGFNLPFDLSRLAISTATSHARQMRGAFSFKLAPEPWLPAVLVKHLNSRAAFIRFAGIARQVDGNASRKKKVRTQVRNGFFIDVKTLAAALLGKSHSLASLAKALETPHRKMEADGHGQTLTPEYLDYAATDVQVTLECYRALRGLYKKHGLTDTPAHRIYSEASIGKAYLRQMDVVPWRKLQPDFPEDMLGIIMSSYFGGRAEVRIRRQIARVLYCDFRSMYPTVCTLMDLWRFVIAKGVTWSDCTADTEGLLSETDLANLQEPEFWQSLSVLVQVAPDDDVLPVRSHYAETSRTIGLNRLTAPFPLWYTLADCIASKLLTGKAPKVVKAIRFEPLEAQDDLTPITIGGDDRFQIDPANDDFYKRVIELRGTVQDEEKAAKDAGRLSEVDRLSSYSQMLKLLANSTSYGIFAELNVQSHNDLVSVCCHGAEDHSFFMGTHSVEEAGTHFHPLIATLITGAARLMLATAERVAADHGLSWAFCDTDSLALARPNDMDDAEFLKRAENVTDWFSELSPYDDAAPLFKIEGENYRLVGGSPEIGQHEPLYALAISAKRYVLFNLDTEGQPIIRKALAHGLGHLLPPYTEADAPKDIRRLQ